MSASNWVDAGRASARPIGRFIIRFVFSFLLLWWKIAAPWPSWRSASCSSSRDFNGVDPSFEASFDFLLQTRGFHWINEVPFNR
jgi:hypothetical protein